MQQCCESPGHPEQVLTGNTGVQHTAPLGPTCFTGARETLRNKESFVVEGSAVVVRGGQESEI